MTPYSAAAGGSFSSRESSRSAALRGVLGEPRRRRSARAARSSPPAARRPPPARPGSPSAAGAGSTRAGPCRSPTGPGTGSASRAGSTSSSRARICESRRRRRATSTSSSSSCFSSVGDPQRAGDQVRERRGVVDVGDRELQLLGQVRDLLDDLGEGALDVAGQRLELGRLLDDVGQLRDPRDEVGLLGDVVPERAPAACPGRGCAAMPSGTLSIRATTPTTPTS